MTATESQSTAHRNTTRNIRNQARWTMAGKQKQTRTAGIIGRHHIDHPADSVSINTSRCVLAEKAAIWKRKYGSATNTKIGDSRILFVRTRGGNRKFRALHLDSGNFAWALKGTARFIDVVYSVVYNASNNELVPNKTEECHHHNRFRSLPSVVRKPLPVAPG